MEVTNQTPLRNGLRWRCRMAQPLSALLVMALFVAAAPPPDSPVADAAMRGDVEAVRRLLRQGADVNAAQGDGMTALHWAAERGDAELAEMLVYAGANVEAGTRIGSYTPLHVAARGGSAVVVQGLLDAGANPQSVTRNSGATPLHLAAASGSPAAVTALLDHGADVNVRAAWGQTPLIFAAASNRADAVKVLLERGANPGITARAVDVVERAEADEAAEERLQEVLSQFHEEDGGDEWQPTPAQVQAAIQEAREIQRDWPNVKRRQEKENGEDEAGAEPSEGEEETGEQAKAEGENNEQGEEAEEGKENAEEEGEDDEPRPPTYAELVGSWGGLTPLLHAARQGHVEAAVALLEGGADINQVSAGDSTSALLMATINGQFDLAMLLLERGADPNLASEAGATPLYAVLERQWAPRASYAHPTEHRQQETRYLDLLEALLKGGANPNVRLKKHLWYMEYTFQVLRLNTAGATPFWRAAYALDVDAMRLLKAYGADLSVPSVKPPERRRGEDEEEEEEQEEGEAEQEGEEEEQAKAEKQAKAAEKEETEEEQKTGQEQEAEEEEGQGEEEKEDPSGVPPVPVGGPAIYPIHAASGVGYGEVFAANAHRHVPDGWLPAVKFLIEECGAEVNARDHNANTPLHHAAARGDIETILYLVERGADVTVLNRKGQTTADMANGPVQRVPPYPEAIELLESLGSKNNHNCVSC